MYNKSLRAGIWEFGLSFRNVNTYIYMNICRHNDQWKQPRVYPKYIKNTPTKAGVRKFGPENHICHNIKSIIIWT